MMKSCLKKKTLLCLFFLCILLSGCEKVESISLNEYFIDSIGDYHNIEVPDINIDVDEDEVESEKEYLLIQDATVEKVTNRSIQKGDIVYVTYTLLNQSKEAITEYENIETDFCVGDLEFDEFVETELLGKKSGDLLQFLQIDGQRFIGEKQDIYINLKVNSIEEFVYPELTTEYLQEKYHVNNVDEFMQYVKEYTWNIKYDLELQEVKDDILENIVEKTVFGQQYHDKRKLRYEELINGYERYGDLYGLTLEEVLEMFDLSKEIVQENADYFEGSWEVAQYIIKAEELQLSAKEMKKAQEEYAKENGYENAEDLLSDSGLQYVTEEIYIEIVKDFLYEQAEKR